MLGPPRPHKQATNSGQSSIGSTSGEAARLGPKRRRSVRAQMELLAQQRRKRRRLRMPRGCWPRGCMPAVGLLLLFILGGATAQQPADPADPVEGPPKAATCRLASRQAPDRKELGGGQLEAYRQLVQPLQNSLQFVPTASQAAGAFYEDPKDQRAAEVASLLGRRQWPFESVCHGWRNQIPMSVQGDPRKPAAMWVRDDFRGALVAKFLFHGRADLADVTGRETRLVSPPFPPVPAYHSWPRSSHFGSCKLTFSAYLTVAAHLDVRLFQVAASSSLARQKQVLEAEAAHTLETVVGSNKKPVPRKDADRVDEATLWREYRVQLPQNLSSQRPYVLEFAAMPAAVTSTAFAPTYYLSGVAIANISLAPQCFGFNISQEELERVKLATGQDPRQAQLAYRSAHDLTSDHQENGHFRSLKNWLQALRMEQRALLAVAAAVALLTPAVLYLLTVRLCSAQKLPPSHQLNYGYQQQHNNRLHKFYLASQQRANGNTNSSQSTNKKKKQNGGHLWWWLPGGRRRRQMRRVYQAAAYQVNQPADKSQQHNYLRPLASSVLEDVELAENPQYLQAAGAHQTEPMLLLTPTSQGGFNNFSNFNGELPLAPYQIDRRRLTLTKPLGKGAFGEVYQGLLVCYHGDDDSGEHEDCESHSIKVAVKTLTDDRMSRSEFIQEAVNMSLVSHRNIVELLGVCFEERPLYIVMELLPGGNLKNFLVHNRGSPRTPQTGSLWSLGCQQTSQDAATTNQQQQRVQLCMGDLLVFGLDIARACDYLQRQKFIHQDLAARNCLLTSSSRQFSLTPTTAQQQQQPPSQMHTKHPSWSSSASIQSSTAASPTPLVGPATHFTTNAQDYLLATTATGARANSTTSTGPPSALEVCANHKVELEEVYLSGYQNSGMVAKLADFGMTRDIYSKDYYRIGHKKMPVRWLPPECLELEGVATTKSDVWSFGVLLWELFSMGQLPYQDLLDNGQVVEFIKQRRSPARSLTPTPAAAAAADFQQAADESQTAVGPPLPPPHDQTPHPVYAIMCACWQTNPSDRPQFEEIANRLYWCLQMPHVLAAPLPSFHDSPPTPAGLATLQPSPSANQTRQQPVGYANTNANATTNTSAANTNTSSDPSTVRQATTLAIITQPSQTDDTTGNGDSGDDESATAQTTQTTQLNWWQP